jgi:hypothetical protein
LIYRIFSIKSSLRKTRACGREDTAAGELEKQNPAHPTPPPNPGSEKISEIKTITEIKKRINVIKKISGQLHPIAIFHLIFTLLNNNRYF